MGTLGGRRRRRRRRRRPGTARHEEDVMEAHPSPTVSAAIEPVLRVEREGAVAWLILNRPRALNALDEPLLFALEAALSRLGKDQDLGALVLTGSGTRAFCYGTDLNTLDAADASTWVKKDGRWLCALHTESLIGDPYGRDRRTAH